MTIPQTYNNHPNPPKTPQNAEKWAEKWKKNPPKPPPNRPPKSQNPPKWAEMGGK